MCSSGTKTRRFPGKNTFCCWGRCVCAKDYQGGIFCFVMLFVTGGLFFGTDCPYLVTHVSLAIPIVGAVIWVLIIAALAQTFFMDPGIIPRPSEEEVQETERLYYRDHPDERPDSTPSKKKPWFMEVEVRGRKFKLNYCRTCKMYRPPRATHCGRCDNCVEMFDHHCAMVGNCVGKRNYRYFYTFITLTSLMSCYVIGCNITVIVLRSNNTSVPEALMTSITSIIEAVICLFSLTTVGGLAFYHTGLVARGITTNEDLKEVFNPKRVRNHTNPYHHGSWLANFVHTFCSPRTPSLLDSSNYVTLSEDVRVSDNITCTSDSKISSSNL